MNNPFPWRYLLLSAAIVLALSAYTAYWFILADEIERGFTAWAEARRADGMTIEYDTLKVTGFPLRVQPQITNARISGPGEKPAWEWRSALLIGNILPYQINHIVLTAPQPQDIGLRIDEGEIEQYHLAPQRALASIRLKNGKLNRLDADIEGGALSGGRLLAHALSLGRAQLHWRAGENGEIEGLKTPVLFDISLKLENLDYPGFEKSALGTHLTHLALTGAIEGALPAQSEIADAVRQWADAGGVAQLKAAEIEWGPLKMNAAGTLALDKQDRVIGSLTARLANYEALIRGLQDAGQLNKDEARAASTGMAIISMAAGGKDGELTLPMTLQDGEMFVGPLRLAKLKPVF